MCDNWKRYREEPEKIKEELTFAQIGRFVKNNKDWLGNLKHIGLSGGEPLLRKDLVDIIRLFREELPWVKVGLQTNGLLPQPAQKVLSAILAFYPELSLAVSLDGLEKTHDQIRGVKGGYARVIKTIKIAQELGVKEISAGMTVTEKNYEEIMDVKKIVEEFGLEFAFYPADSGDYYHRKRAKSLFPQKIKESLLSAFALFPGDYFRDNFRLQLLGKRQRKLPCYSGLTSFVIDPYGEVKPCVLRNESLGNIKNEPLQKILTGEKAKKIRQEIKKCSCWSLCEVSTSAILDPWDVLFWFLFYANKRKFWQGFKEKQLRLI
ncbi:MAG: radical SAM protein [Patescibacteria group bacterium]|nr:radical SAM protein [Patescibacteria group bacterium]